MLRAYGRARSLGSFAIGMMLGCVSAPSIAQSSSGGQGASAQGTGQGDAAATSGNSPASGESSGGSSGGSSGASGAETTSDEDAASTAEGSGSPESTTDTAPGDDDANANANATAEGGPSCAGVFCEDFEEGQIDATKWDMQAKGGDTLMVEQQTVAHGRYAAQFHGVASPTGGSGYVYLISKNAPMSLQTHNFGRAYFYISPKVTSNNLGLVFGGTSGFPDLTYMSIASHSSGWQFGFIKLDGSPQGESQAYPPSKVPVNTWTCLEWEFNDQPDEINVWGDGAAIGSLNANDVAYPSNHPAGSIFNNMSSGLIGAFTDFGIGFYDWHPGGFDFDVYYDDIVLGTQRVGCL
jgi:hypothetical protein